MEKVALDRGYDTGAVHGGLEMLGITGYFTPSTFLMTRVNTDFHIAHNKIHLFAQCGSLLYVTG